jgi:DNA modification methylase
MAVKKAEKAKDARAAAVKVTAAKGRPMLSWVGKRPLTRLPVFPAQHIETFDPTEELAARKVADGWAEWPGALPTGGLLFHGDNKEVLAYLLAAGFRGKVDLIYVDPPFDSGADYVRRVELRGAKGNVKLGGEGYALGEQIQYTDIWTNDNYLQFMYERLLLLKELLAATGSVYLHCDWRRVHQLRAVMDEVFGSENFLNEVIWYFANKLQGNVNRFATNHNNLLYYAKSKDSYTFNRIEEERERPIKVNKRWWDSEKGFFATERDADGKVVYTERAERIIDDVWIIPAVSSDETKQVDYPTQKPDQLLERALIASSNKGDLVLDAFIGSGTTGLVAQRLGRRWIGCDINRGAIQTTSKQLQGVIEEQIAASQQGELIDSRTAAQLSFTTWRVNDYDLQVQHNEAVGLACEHLGVQRSRTDTFFDGTLGKRLAKIVPFNHPLSPDDLEELKRELDTRKEEDRDIAMICLGIELAARAWLEDWNQLRRGANSVNRIEAIELRTDERFGEFLEHKPAEARVSIVRKKDKLVVQIKDFVSPTIISRLAQQTGVVAPRVAGWRAMVDCVMIDPAFDGKVFDIAVADVPARKSDLVEGSYELPAPKGKATVAVKIVDMLGEEVLVMEHITAPTRERKVGRDTRRE